jgi:hypothetical protein
MGIRDERLKGLVDFILNSATEDDLHVIQAAVHRRTRTLESKAHFGANPAKMASETAAMVSEQVGVSQEGIRVTVRNLVRDIIKQNAPDIDPETVDRMIEEMVPQGEGRHGSATEIPRDAMLTMVDQFLMYSTGQMSPGVQAKMWDEIPDWQRKYWKAFPQPVQELISVFLRGGMDSDEFWRRVNEQI